MRELIITGSLAVALATVAQGQTPQPFPRQQMKPAAVTPAPPASPAPAPTPQVAPAPATAQAAAINPERPTAEQLGVFIPASAKFVASYDAGRGQRYYLFGSTQSYAEVVLAYRTALKDKGTQVFEQPPTHTWEIGKFREESMGFPPGVTVKDFTANGAAGYPNPARGEQPERFATIIQVVPPPPGAPRR